MIMKQYALLLNGKKGEKIFRKIYNAPRVPYEKLKEESEEIKSNGKQRRMEKDNNYLLRCKESERSERLCRLRD